jgi:hypothetical protein
VNVPNPLGDGGDRASGLSTIESSSVSGVPLPPIVNSKKAKAGKGNNPK